MRISVLTLFCTLGLLSACSENPSSDKDKTTVDEKQEQQTEKETASFRDSDEDRPEQAEKNESTSMEDRLIDKIYALPEVHELEASVNKKSGGKRRLSLRITSEPSDDQEYYGITVAEDNGAALATYYEFHVYPDFDIRFYDVVEDQELSLEEWRKTR